MREGKKTKMEFLIKLNNDIIIQRIFNVIGYNDDSVESIDLYEVFKGISDDIEEKMKINSVYYLLDNQSYIESEENYLNTNKTEENETFHIYLKDVKGNVLMESGFDGKKFPPEIRYSLDIRPKVRGYLRDITVTLASENEDLEFNYIKNK